MYCVSCGVAHESGATVCVSCGQPIRQFPIPPPIQNHLGFAIFVTLCCCLPLGIVSLIFAAQVNSKLAAGDVAGAQKSAQTARTWGFIAFIVGLLTFGAGGALVTFLDK